MAIVVTLPIEDFQLLLSGPPVGSALGIVLGDSSLVGEDEVFTPIVDIIEIDSQALAVGVLNRAFNGAPRYDQRFDCQGEQDCE